MKPEKKYVVIKGTKEKLELISISGNISTIKNTKGQIFNIPSNYLENFTKELNE